MALPSLEKSAYRNLAIWKFGGYARCHHQPSGAIVFGKPGRRYTWSTMPSKSAPQPQTKRRKGIITHKGTTTIAVNRIDSTTLNSAFTQILLLSCSLAKAYRLQIKSPFNIHVTSRSGNCIMIIEASFNQGSCNGRVVELNVHKTGVGMPVSVLIEDRDGKRVKALIQRRSRKTVPKELL